MYGWVINGFGVEVTMSQDTVFVDSNGRVIPFAEERVYSFLDRRYFCLDKQDISLAKVYDKYREIFGAEMLAGINLEKFVNKIETLHRNLEMDQSMANLLSGVSVPFILPRKNLIDSAGGWDFLLECVKKSFENSFPEYEFRNIPQEALDVEVVPESRWSFLEKEFERNPIVGLYFPTALSGFAIPDHVKVLSRLDKRFVLSGIPEVACALVGSPGLLMKSDGKYPNLLSLSSFKSRNSSDQHFFWFFEAYGWNLYFNKRSMLGAVSEYYSGGLTLFA